MIVYVLNKYNILKKNADFQTIIHDSFLLKTTWLERSWTFIYTQIEGLFG